MRVECFKRTASKHVYYLGWNRSPAQVGCMRQVLGPGILGRPRRIGWRGRWEGGLGWGIHVYPRLIHVHVWQEPLQYCKVIGLQLIKKNNNNHPNWSELFLICISLKISGVEHKFLSLLAICISSLEKGSIQVFCLSKTQICFVAVISKLYFFKF